MKILIFNSLYYPNVLGGAEISTQLLAESLSKIGLKPVVVSISNKESISSVNGVKVYYLNYSNLYWLPNAKKRNRLTRGVWHLIDMYNLIITKKVNKIIDIERPDIAHTNNLAGLSVSLWGILRRRNIPIVHTLRDYYLLCPRSTMYVNGKNCEERCFSCRIFSIIKKTFSYYVDTVVGVSNFIINRHLKEGYFAKAKPHVIYNSITNVNHKLKSKVNKPLVFCYIGVLAESKGIELLLEVFKEIRSDEKLVICGRGVTEKYEEKLKKKYQSKNIKFLGFVDIKEVLPEVDVLIVPSLWNEPFSRVIIEAYSYGVPVIASNRGGMFEIINEGKTGFMFDPGDEVSLWGSINLFLKNPGMVSEMHENCFKKAENFIQDKIGTEYLKVYSMRLGEIREQVY